MSSDVHLDWEEGSGIEITGPAYRRWCSFIQ